MGLKRLETRHIALQHIKNLGLNELHRNYGLISKNRVKLRNMRKISNIKGFGTLMHIWVQLKSKCCNSMLMVES